MRSAYIEVKYEIVAHIHVARKYWRIPVPINFLEAELETQLVWYWTVTDDLRRAVDPSQMNQLHMSFSVELEDGNLEIKNFGVRFLCQEHILKLRGTRFTVNGVPNIMKLKVTSLLLQDLRCYRGACEAGQELLSFSSSFQDRTWKVIAILTNGCKHDSISLDSLREVVESLLEMNQEVVKVILECKEEIRKDEQLFCLVHSCVINNLPILKLCSDLVKLLECTGDSWLVVQVAMQQIEAKRRAGTPNYLEAMQQLIDLEAAWVPFSKELITLFKSFCDQQVTDLRYYNDQRNHEMKSKSAEAWCKVLNVTTAVTLGAVLISAVATLRIAEPLPMMTTRDYDHVLHTWICQWEFRQKLEGYDDKDKEKGYENYSENFDWDVSISDFYGILKLLEELKSKMDLATWPQKCSKFCFNITVLAVLPINSQLQLRLTVLQTIGTD